MSRIYSLLLLLSLLILPVRTSAQEKTESTDVRLILNTFEGQRVSELLPKIDLLIETGKTPEEQSLIAYYIFEYYSKSKIMGYEECALYIADNYFLNEKLKPANDAIRMTMKMFAEFNRSSMIGMQAPTLLVQDKKGNIDTLPEGNAGYKYTLLYFYDDDCASCKMQTPQIMNYLSLFYEAQVHLYRIYTEKDFGRWQNYIQQTDQKYPCPENIHITDVWDPEMNSDFPRKYCVISTPQLFLLNRENKIIGRKLNAKALAQLIRIHQEEPTEFDLFFDKIFKKMLSPDPQVGLDTEYAYKILEAFYKDSYEQPKIYDEIFYNLYLYLSKQEDYEFQKLAVFLAEKYILGQPELWKDAQFSPTERTQDDGILVGNYTDVQDFMTRTTIEIDLFRRNPLGEPCSDLTLRDPKNRKVSIYQSDAEYTVLYFYSLDCAVCEAVDLDMRSICQEFRGKDVCFIAINTGKKKSRWKKHIQEDPAGWTEAWDPKRESGLFNKYDLSEVPAIYLLDRDKNTLAKDIPPAVLEDILNYLLPEAENK